MSSAVQNFLKTLRIGNVSSGSNQELMLQASIIKTLDDPGSKNFSIASLKKFFTNTYFRLTDKEILINDTPIRKIESLLRSGQLKEFYNLFHLSHEITISEEYNFQSLLLPNIPDIHIFRLAEKYKQAQLQHSDLDILVTSSKDIERKLTKSAREKLDVYLNRIRSMAPKNEFVHGIFTSIRNDDNLLENIAVAAYTRPGCYLVKTDKAKTTSFKLITRSCFPPNTSRPDNNDEFTSLAKLLQYNLQIYLRIVVKNEMEIRNLRYALGLMTAEITEINIPYLIIKYESKLWKYFCGTRNYGNKLYDQLSDMEKKALHEKLFDINDESPCISCSPHAPKNSVHYVDISNLPVNMSMMCVKKTTLLELLVEIGVSLSIWNCSIL